MEAFSVSMYFPPIYLTVLVYKLLPEPEVNFTYNTARFPGVNKEVNIWASGTGLPDGLFSNQKSQFG
jgi:hypothetical protein